MATERLRVTVHQPLWLEWSYRDDAGEWQPLVNDRPTSAYLVNAHGDGVAHYQSRRQDERFYGLGEKAGNLQRNGNRYEMRNLDAMGYNAPAPIRCISTSPSPSPSAAISATACSTITSAAAGWIWATKSTTTTPPIAAGRPKRAILITTCLPANACWTSLKPLSA
ncbi:Uncharacterised protein [Raoultella terrigena]|uniref:Glycoside hydrolase family 31 N-terminal domain-containing protein n=1 Tax=Raoultella terrigena TaxID=577 RepID=A0A4U9D9B4_RAOTE|nr:Uncharacterised protein [Raoultella terrigena]